MRARPIPRLHRRIDEERPHLAVEKRDEAHDAVITHVDPGFGGGDVDLGNRAPLPAQKRIVEKRMGETRGAMPDREQVAEIVVPVGSDHQGRGAQAPTSLQTANSLPLGSAK